MIGLSKLQEMEGDTASQYGIVLVRNKMHVTPRVLVLVCLLLLYTYREWTREKLCDELEIYSQCCYLIRNIESLIALCKQELINILGFVLHTNYYE